MGKMSVNNNSNNPQNSTDMLVQAMNAVTGHFSGGGIGIGGNIDIDTALRMFAGQGILGGESVSGTGGMPPPSSGPDHTMANINAQMNASRAAAMAGK